MIFVILATGPSMNQQTADFVKGKAKVIAVSDSFRLAPWADALCSSDRAWWDANPDALDFEGRKFTAAPDHAKMEGVERLSITTGSNSGLLACHAALKMGAEKILLAGFDMKGSHYFGPHQKLKNTTPQRFEVFKKQLASFKMVDVVNCTTGSALTCFRSSTLEKELA